MSDQRRRYQYAYRIASGAVLGRIFGVMAVFSLCLPTAWMDFTTSYLVPMVQQERSRAVLPPIDMAQPPLVFIHIGDDKDRFPPYLGEAVRQAVRWNANMRILVVISQKFINGSQSSIEQLLSSPYLEDAAYWKERIEVVPTEAIPLSIRRVHFMNVSTLSSGFWKYTTERLFALAEVLDNLRIDEAFHMENDNMLYARLGDLLPTMRKLYPNLACTNIGRGQATAGFFYVHQRKALENFLDFVIENPGLNDMQTLWEFATKHGRENLAILPGDPVGSEQTDIAEVRQLGGIYDGAAHGQLLGGTNNGHPPGFVNSRSGVGGYEYRWHADSATGLRRPFVRCQKTSLSPSPDNEQYEQWIPIFNLHIHCKQLHHFAS